MSVLTVTVKITTWLVPATIGEPVDIVHLVPATSPFTQFEVALVDMLNVVFAGTTS